MQELIFVSKKAVFKPPKAIRGGVPVCFPQFGGFGPLQQHGFARNSAFEVAAGSQHSVTLVLVPDAEQLKLFPHAFRLKVTVRGPSLADGKTFTCMSWGVKSGTGEEGYSSVYKSSCLLEGVAACRHGQGRIPCGASAAIAFAEFDHICRPRYILQHSADTCACCRSLWAPTAWSSGWR